MQFDVSDETRRDRQSAAQFWQREERFALAAPELLLKGEAAISSKGVLLQIAGFIGGKNGRS